MLHRRNILNIWGDREFHGESFGILNILFGRYLKKILFKKAKIDRNFFSVCDSKTFYPITSPIYDLYYEIAKTFLRNPMPF